MRQEIWPCPGCGRNLQFSRVVLNFDGRERCRLSSASRAAYSSPQSFSLSCWKRPHQWCPGNPVRRPYCARSHPVRAARLMFGCVCSNKFRRRCGQKKARVGGRRPRWVIEENAMAAPSQDDLTKLRDKSRDKIITDRGISDQPLQNHGLAKIGCGNTVPGSVGGLVHA